MSKRLNQLTELYNIIGTEVIPIQNGEQELQKISFNTIVNNIKMTKFTNELAFYCIEEVTVLINGVPNVYPQNSDVHIFLSKDDTFEIITTSDNSILTLTKFPKPLDTFYPWLEGVTLFQNIVFDMNDLAMYEKWNQGHQGQYKVQFAQYKNCIFWSDNAYISDVAKRTNYTLYNSSELPLCFSLIPENTYKAFYFAYSVTSDPNWANPLYKASFALATWATQTFSYYGLKSIGLFDMDSSEFNITLPKDCRGLMFYAPNIENAGVFDAINVTNFGAKSGSWRDAFAYCYSLKNLYIKNLKVNINVSWSPINQQSLQFIIDNAANTNAITIFVSPYTYYRISTQTFTTASNKNISISLIATNYTEEDYRVNILQTNGNGDKVLTDNGNYRVLTEYVTHSALETKVNESIANIINNAPETLDTLGELADAFNENADVVSVLNSAIGNKSDIGHTHDERYYTKEEVDRLLDNFVSKDVVAQMIQEALDNYNNSETPDTPVEPEPDTPVEPEVPIENIGSIAEDNSIIIDETQLENGVYTLKYIDSNDNIIDNFNDITTFEINN